MRCIATLLLALFVVACSAPEAMHQGSAADRFHAYVDSPPLLRAFLYRMPKGGDLHSHLSGATYAEGLIRMGAERGWCFDPKKSQVAKPPCKPPLRPLSEAARVAKFQRPLVDAWSMRSFVPTSGNSGHDHFFGAFERFGGAATPAMMAQEVVDRAGRQRMRYVELMITFQGSAVGDLADRVNARTPWTGDMDSFQAALMGAGLPDIVRKAAADVRQLGVDLRQRQQCGTPLASPGCGVMVGWLQQVNRTASPGRVYAQTLFGALLQQAAPDVVGLDFVAPEDDPVALADYTLQMHMIDHVLRSWPDTHVSLHAGELVMGLVPPEDLLFHIRQAVEIGHARRIGHGVDVMYETDAFGLLREMARRRVAVEINLTSNAQILGGEGPSHPFPIYRAAGVPTVISTDDEGIERIDRTHELQRAVTTYRLSWADLVGLERNTLEYAFLPGESLWADPVAWRRVDACAVHGPRCDALLARSPKARLQWALERDLLDFDREAADLRLTP
ncbi:MAG: adenosine deaminase [Acetobacteraceae bacterium]